MSKENYILDTPLIPQQDYEFLKEEGLSYIQRFSGYEWTNLNTSDPGITILEQVCYALTELGYCNDFPVKDLLTSPEGNLLMEAQFYLPEEILTTSPVTIIDYIKYLADSLNEVRNAVILPVSGSRQSLYQTFLLTNRQFNQEVWAKLCNAAFFCLNKCRGIGELFLMPQMLTKVDCTLKGSIVISDVAKHVKILSDVQMALDDYIFPEIKKGSYKQREMSGISAEEIFNGPELKNGWMLNEQVGLNRTGVQLIDIISVISSVEGVTSVNLSGFICQGKVLPDIEVAANCVISLNIADSVSGNDPSLVVYTSNGLVTLSSSFLSLFKLAQSQVNQTLALVGGKDNNRPEIPVGRYREVDTYYSIQNTFPEIYAVGPNTVEANATAYQIACSRQLKGYLTLFDQVLANQFSQLANIGNLFSFRNSISPTPQWRRDWMGDQSNEAKEHPLYPVPYLAFSPTYFFKPLYDIPHIKPLLKDSDAQQYPSDSINSANRNKESWEEYKSNPYNAYLRGLMEYMEDETVNIYRRNAILDHLLSRHGESPLMINALIKGSIYTGDSAKDQVVFKSLYLQNLGRLSYYRQKAYDFLGSNKLDFKLMEVPVNYDNQILAGDSIDFIFRTGLINEIEKLKEGDFIGFSALELKMSLLFGFRVMYRNFIANNYLDTALQEEVKLAYWLIRNRRGVILLEKNLLLQSSKASGFNQLVTDGSEIGADILIFLPSFLEELCGADFLNKLNLYLKEICPVNVTFGYALLANATLTNLLTLFVNWHNSLVYNETSQLINQETESNAKLLLECIHQIEITYVE